MLKKIMIFSLAWLSVTAFAGDKIEKKYNHKIAVLTHKYKSAQLKKIKSTIATYKALQKKALKAKDLDGAIRIKKAVDVLKKQLKSGEFKVAKSKKSSNRIREREKYIAFDLVKGTKKKYRTVPDGGWGDEFKTTKLLMRRIPKGSFSMGAPLNELGRFGWEKTPRKVTLTKDYYIGVFELTRAQYKLITGEISPIPPAKSLGEDLDKMRPVDGVSYCDIRGDSLGNKWPIKNKVDRGSMLAKLRAKCGRKAFDLPTEAQWQYACRAGTTTALNSGKNLTSTGTDPEMDKVGWYSGNNTTNGEKSGTKVVGRKAPNNWGLYDMHGNAWEWCIDLYSGSQSESVDPKGPRSGDSQYLLGGYYYAGAAICRSTVFRCTSKKSGHIAGGHGGGLRLVLPADR